MQQASKQMLDEYWRATPTISDECIAEATDGYFCADETNANLCAQLIVNGEKQASCSLLLWYTEQGEAMPKVGHLHVVTDWNNLPLCIIEITDLETCPYDKVSAAFAAAEGEGDKTLAWWRKAHWDFFSMECQELGIAMHEDRELLLERFKVVWPPQQ